MSITHRTFARALCLRRRHARRLAVAATALFSAACGGSGYDAPTDPSGQPGGPPGPTATVQATPSIRFTPASVEVAVGGTVTFDFGAVAHNVFFDNAPSGAPQNIVAPTVDQSVTRTFTTAGQYTYNCHIHPGMTGTVTVR